MAPNLGNHQGRLVLAGAVAALLVGCGGGGGGSSGGGESGSTATGVFLDSAVEGLGYVSGNSSGLTNAEGEFVYEVGNVVRFTVGDILIGEAPGQSLITPVNLVPDGDADNPTVLNIARFLQTIDDDNDTSNGIQITPLVTSLAEGRSIDFSQSSTAFSDDGNVQIIVSELTAATTGGARGLVSTSVAKAHLSNTIWTYFAGTYEGTFSGGDSGTWNVSFLSDGSIVGTGVSNNIGGGFSVNGAVGTDGSLAFATGGTSTGVGFSGTLTSDFTISGTYSGNGVTGTFSGRRTGGGAGQDSNDPDSDSTSIGSVVFSGSVSGTYTPLTQQYTSLGDDLIVAWGGMDGILGVTVPLSGGSGDQADLNTGFTVFSCATNLFGTTIGDCSGLSHDSGARTVSFDDVILIGPAIGDTVRVNGTLSY